MSKHEIDDKETNIKQTKSKEVLDDQNIPSSNSDNKEDVSLSDEATTSKNNEPSVHLENIKKVKIFFVSDMDEEAAYLHEMSLQGYHFVNKESVYHIFTQGEPKNYYYHLGYYEKDKRDGDHYLDNYLDAGWENIFHEKAEFDGIWNYFRIEMPAGEPEPNIFSDRVSRMALYQRMLSSWRSLLAMIFICFLAMIFVCYFLATHPSKLTWIFMTMSVIVFIVIILTLLIYSRAYLKISRKLEELKNL